MNYKFNDGDVLESQKLMIWTFMAWQPIRLVMLVQFQHVMKQTVVMPTV